MHQSHKGEIKITPQNQQEIFVLLGKQDENLKIIQQYFPNLVVVLRGEQLLISGNIEEVQKVNHLFDSLLSLHRSGSSITNHDIHYGLKNLEKDGEDQTKLAAETVLVTVKGKHVKPKTTGQQQYLDCIRENDITFGVGPAGTGKTYLAVAMAVHALKNRVVEKIILTRPAVEAGEKLGFLPGDLQEKVDPYLRPLHDALNDILGTETFQKYTARNIIEVAPLAYMRGRTLSDAFIILDESQNTTSEQMKMFLTRLGFGSKAVVTGDITQIDLPSGKCSGLKQALQILQDVQGIGFVMFDETDVVRHEIVSRIIRAYSRFEEQSAKRME